ncbi:VCBS repeat-containing protein [Luteolibacter pohnpeiensis]|uniref:VCBS repeat-containing protein n=1 Tax=Luteolibacter pohnpeiensis TaxID=454153 RepID=A0A934S6P0_9BACT|nr:VCBS repeat-containing protein [Luteolibacter pohnpeiensis]MBK1882255.1 VCBS repeat-containing protein [Luteolibacter pohnpeiensis]
MKRVLIAAAISLFPFFAQAIPAGFKPRVDLTESTNFSSSVWIDADGNGVEELAGISVERNQLMYSPRYAASGASSGRKFLPGVLISPHGSVLKADIDRDGRKDLVMQDENRLVWWRSVPDAEMVFMNDWVTDLPQGRQIDFIVDMDGDGVLDLLMGPETEVVNFDTVTHSAEIGYGNGNGAFEWVVVIAEGGDAAGSAGFPVDVDGDGDLDWPVNSNLIALMQGRSVVTLQNYPEGVSSYRTIFADIDGEAGAELLCMQGFRFTNELNPKIEVMKWQAGGGWSMIDDFSLSDLGVSYFERPTELGVVVGNFDSDPAEDILICSGNYAYKLGWRIGSLVKDQYLSWENGPAVEDWASVIKNDAGGLDSLLIDSSLKCDNVLGETVALGGGPLWRVDFSESRSIPSIPVQVTSFHDARSFAMFNMDGKPTLASLGGKDKSLSVWDDLSGVSGRKTITTMSLPGIGIFGGNFRGNTDNELVWMTSSEYSTVSFVADYSYLMAGRPYTNDGQSYGDSRSTAFFGSRPAALLGAGDFDGDGIDDVLYARSSNGMLIWRSGVEPSTADLALKTFGIEEHEIAAAPFLFSNSSGFGSVSERAQITGAEPQNYVVRDMDGDGDLDIIQFPSIYGNVAALFSNDGTGEFTSKPIGPESADAGAAVAVGNFDGSGALDLVLIYRSYSSSGENACTVKICPDVGTGPTEDMQLDLLFGKAAVADFNADGLDDLVLAGGIGLKVMGEPITDSQLIVYARKHSQSFEPPFLLSNEVRAASALMAGDFNGDGKADLVHGSAIDGTVSYFESADMDAWPSFSDWAAANGVEATNQDADGDGATNFQEYLTGRNPKLAEDAGHTGGEPGEAPWIEVEMDDSYFMTYHGTLHAKHAIPRQLASGTSTVVLEQSDDLIEWEPVESSPTATQSTTDPNWLTLSWDLNVYIQEGGSAKFYRFNTSLN